ncbi:MAG: hypothetical protein MSH40_07120 [Christensenella sp.]|nr:hypothetical protein [Christensenella sp.]
MKKKEIFEKLNKELDNVVPKLDSRILSTPLQAKQEEEIIIKESFSDKVKNVFSLKRTWIATASIALVLVVTILALVFSPLLKTQEIEEASYSCYVVDINPSVILTVDEKGNVVNVSALNEDGNVLLNNVEINKDTSLEESIQSIITSAMKLGYIDVSSLNNAVKLSVTSKDKQDEKINLAKSYIESVFMNEGVYGVVLAQGKNEEELIKLLNISADKNSFYDSVKSYPKFTYMVGDINEQIKQVEIELKQEFLDMYVEKLDNFKSLLSEFIAINDGLYEETGKDFFLVKESDLTNDQLTKYARGKEIIEILENEYTYRLTSYKLQNIDVIATILDMVKLYLSMTDVSELNVNVLIDRFNEIFGENSFETIGLGSILENIPSDEESYLLYYKNIYESKYANLINNNASKYESNREQISSQSYKEYIETIITNYGSIENFYNFIKNNQ